MLSMLLVMWYTCPAEMSSGFIIATMVETLCASAQGKQELP